jgi:serine/threonine-protein kinase
MRVRLKSMVAVSPHAAAEASLEPTARPLGDRYQSLFVIGEGGMGRVEAALQRGEAGFERVVALKRLLPKGPRDARHVQMFMREARIATLVNHPNVVRAFAFGEADGELFLAMQYVEGEPLSRILAASCAQGKGLEPVLVAWLLADACDGLHAAHELCDAEGKPLRVVHRDVSPHNVMVSYTGNVKVVDFGIARFDSGGIATRTGEVKGKLAYMSPEQALGEELDRRSDVFSMGAVLFECLTGERMWGDGTDVELMRRIALERPSRIDSIRPGVPKVLADLQAQMVARDAAARPASAHDVALQLRAFALSTGGPTSRRLLAATMTALFGEEARRRRDRLALALQQVAAPSAVALPADLEPAASVPPEAPSQSRRWLVTAIVASLAIGLAAIAWAPRHATPVPLPAKADRPSGNAETPPAATAIDSAPAGAPPGENAAVAPPVPKPASKPATAPAKSAPTARPAPLRKLPDVDRSPF